MVIPTTAEQLIDTYVERKEKERKEPKELSWKKTSNGYTMKYKGSVAKLFKDGKKWKLSYKGKDHILGRSPSFDSAEKVLINV